MHDFISRILKLSKIMKPHDTRDVTQMILIGIPTYQNRIFKNFKLQKYFYSINETFKLFKRSEIEPNQNHATWNLDRLVLVA